MAVEVKKLQAALGDIVEAGNHRYEVVEDREGGLALEPAITKTVSQMRAERGGRELTSAQFDELFGELPSDEEG